MDQNIAMFARALFYYKSRNIVKVLWCGMVRQVLIRFPVRFQAFQTLLCLKGMDQKHREVWKALKISITKIKLASFENLTVSLV